MICRSVSRTIVALGLVWAVQSPWLPTSEAGGRNETPRVFVHEDGGFFASVWSSLTTLWDKNGCSIDPNGCPPFPLNPEKDPRRSPPKGPKGPVPPNTNGQ